MQLRKSLERARTTRQTWSSQMLTWKIKFRNISSPWVPPSGYDNSEHFRALTVIIMAASGGWNRNGVRTFNRGSSLINAG